MGEMEGRELTWYSWCSLRDAGDKLFLSSLAGMIMMMRNDGCCVSELRISSVPVSISRLGFRPDYSSSPLLSLSPSSSSTIGVSSP